VIPGAFTADGGSDELPSPFGQGRDCSSPVEYRLKLTQTYGVISGSDGHQTALRVRKARTGATSPATHRARPGRAPHPGCARTHRRDRRRVARPRALARARRHQPLPHPLERPRPSLGRGRSYARNGGTFPARGSAERRHSESTAPQPQTPANLPKSPRSCRRPPAHARAQRG
jgi:hypothetical protein